MGSPTLEDMAQWRKEAEELISVVAHTHHNSGKLFSYTVDVETPDSPPTTVATFSVYGKIADAKTMRKAAEGYASVLKARYLFLALGTI